MRTTLLTLSLCLGLVSTVVGQTVNTLPAGHEKSVGGWGSGNGVSYPFDRGDFHYQEVHQSWTGKGVKILSKVMFRRGQRVASTAAVARTAELTFQMGAGDLTKFTKTFTTNYVSAPTALFSKTKVSMPSRVKKPATSPAPWDISLKFAKSYLYDGKKDLLWELWHQNVSVTGTTYYYTDRARSGSSNSAVGSLLSSGTGCLPSGQTASHLHNMTLYNYGPNGTTYKMRMYLYTTRNPASTPVMMVLGYQALNFQVPGWCEKIYPNPYFFVPMGTSSTSGTLASTYLNIPYYPVVGLPIYSQAYAADSTLPGGISLSNGRTANVPGDPVALTWRYTYTLNVTGTVGAGPYTAGSVITGY